MDIYVTSRMKLKRMINSIKNHGELSLKKIKQMMKKQKIYISPNQAELTAYAIIFSNDFAKYLQENISMGFDPTQRNPLFESEQIEKALQIQKALKSKNFEKFFDILEDEKTDYVMSSLMLDKILNVREQIFSIGL